MAAVLNRLLEGDLNVDDFKKYLKSRRSAQHPCNNSLDLVNPITEFIPYFLNYIREESSHHFTPDLPLISPKKIKKKKKSACPRTPNSDTSNESSRSNARNSLFSSPPSEKLGNVSVSPVHGGQRCNIKISPAGISPSVQRESNDSSGSESRACLQVTSTPVKFNLEKDFPPMSAQNVSKRMDPTPVRRITPTPARSRRGSSNFFNSSTFESSYDSERSFSSFSSEKSKHRQKLSNVNFVGSGSPKNARRNSVKLKLEDFMQPGSRNKDRVKTSSSRRQNISEVNTSYEWEKSSNCGDGLQKGNLNTSRKGERGENEITSTCIVPKKDQVTQANVLGLLAETHSFCIQENLVPNLVVEMCFILQLLTVQGSEKKQNGLNSGILTTVHNCVYYAVLVLENLVRIIKLLDKGTLRLLLDNSRIDEFSTNLKEELHRVYPTIALNKVPYSLIKSPLNSVPFQASIDNRNNFSTDQAFHCFKKQRDTFYEIIREWEEWRSKPLWSLEEKLGNKIRYVVHQKPGLANHSHFARLFQSQLIQMCCYESTFPTFNEGESPELVGNLFKSNPEKFFRLQQRLVTPQSTTADPCPMPGFTETEEFFRQFIVSAMCPSFNRYLMDSFIAKIIELNDTTFSDSLDNSFQDPVSEDDNEKLQVKFASSLITLRTLAKFLGFLVFFPYHSSTDQPQVVIDSLVTTRNQITQPLDILGNLRKAHTEKRLVLTVPWVIEYLSMMDNIAPFLDYYSQVFDFLHHIYRVTLLENSSVNMNRNCLMLSVGLGWLFEMPAVPETKFSKSFANTLNDPEKMGLSFNLDDINLVDQHLLYTCCPYLGELRSILAEAVMGKGTKRGSVKKIKPISADKVETPLASCRLLQTQLEDNFFRNQPEYLKKIVDFVIARIYHNMVSLVKNSVIPTQLEGAKIKLSCDSSFIQRDWEEISKEDFKERNKLLIIQLSNQATDEGMERILADVDKECKSRSFTAVQSLTPQDMDKVVIKTAAGIVHQSTMNKLTEWSHENLQGLIEKQILEDIDKMISRVNNLTINSHSLYANDPENPFNWFYQKLLKKAKENENTMETGATEQREKLLKYVKGSDHERITRTTTVTTETKE